MRKILSKSEAKEAAGGASYSKIWRMMRNGQFPLSVRIAGRVGWYADEVEAWQQALPRTKLKPSAAPATTEPPDPKRAEVVEVASTEA